MRLDMYLTKKTFVGAQYDHKRMKGQVSIKNEDGVSLGIKFKRVSYIEEAVGYWRKANHIHNWFVKNVQGGVDECQQAHVSTEKLKELLATCKEVLADHQKAGALLPTQGGFFFDSTNYDQYYFSNIQNTIDILEPLLEEIETLNKKKVFPYIYYQSSW